MPRTLFASSGRSLSRGCNKPTELSHLPEAIDRCMPSWPFRIGALRELGPASQIERLLSGKPGMEDPPGLRPIVREFMRRVGCLTVPQQGSRFLPALFHS